MNPNIATAAPDVPARSLPSAPWRRPSLLVVLDGALSDGLLQLSIQFPSRLRTPAASQYGGPSAEHAEGTRCCGRVRLYTI